jgi:polysaccharide biosynthesis transport protein
VTLGAAIIYLLRAPKIYASKAVIQVEQETPKVVNIQDINGGDFKTPEMLKTVEQVFLSDTLLLRVLKANGLDKDPVFAPPKPDGTPYLDIELVNRFRPSVKVQLRKATRLIDLSVEDLDPKRSERLTQSIIKEFLKIDLEQKLAVTQQANDFLLQESARLKEKLRSSEQAVQKYREEYNAVSLEDKQNITVEKLKDLNQQVTHAKGERLRLEADVAAIKQGRAKSPDELLLLPSVNNLPIVAALRKDIADREAKYKSDYQVRGLKATLNQAVLNAGELVNNAYQASKATENKLTAALQEQERAALELNRISIPYNVLVREVESNRALYESVLNRMKETGVTRGLAENNIRIVQSPLVSNWPVKPSRLKILALALVGGMVLGSGWAIGLDVTNSSVRNVEQAERAAGLAVLTSVPESKRKRLENEPALLVAPASHEAEAFRSLRTALGLIGHEHGNRTVMITSAGPAEGKTYCSYNYAVALAQLGLRTLLIDADLRRPNLTRTLLPDKNVPGFTECLNKERQLKDCCQQTVIENLSILGGGEHASRPSELLASRDIGLIINQAAQHFDRVVIDSAPVNGVCDTRFLARHVDSICFVIRAGRTHERAVSRACAMLAATTDKLDGIIFNRLSRGSRDLYYFPHYAGGYARLKA